MAVWSWLRIVRASQISLGESRFPPLACPNRFSDSGPALILAQSCSLPEHVQNRRQKGRVLGSGPHCSVDMTHWILRQSGGPQNDTRAAIGMCGGFQHVVVEYTRNVIGIEDADHPETNPAAARLAVTALACSLAGKEHLVRLVAGSRAQALFHGGGPRALLLQLRAQSRLSVCTGRAWSRGCRHG